jgi:hypothetical protein
MNAQMSRVGRRKMDSKSLDLVVPSHEPTKAPAWMSGSVRTFILLLPHQAKVSMSERQNDSLGQTAPSADRRREAPSRGRSTELAGAG